MRICFGTRIDSRLLPDNPVTDRYSHNAATGRQSCTILNRTDMDFNNESNEISGFNIFADSSPEPEIKPASKPLQDETLVVEAVQVIRMVRSSSGHRSREVLDTIKVTYPSMTYERALKIAKHKAKMLGNCMVVEKIERIVDGY